MISTFLGLDKPRGRAQPARNYLTPERIEFNLNDPVAWDVFLAGQESASGERVTHYNALSIAAVWQAVSMLSGDVSKLPMYPYERTDQDDREIATKHRGYFAVSKRANAYKSARLFWRTIMVHSCIWNNGYGYITMNRLGQFELLNLMPDRTAPEWVKVEDARSKHGYRMELVYATEVDGVLHALMPHQVFHVQGISIDGLAGCDLVKMARDVFGLIMARRNFESKFFKNGARVGGVLELPAGMTRPAQSTVEEGFRKTYEGGDNPFKTVILRDGAKFHEAQRTLDESQQGELRTQDKRDVASYFNIPPSKLGIEDSKGYNSYEQDNLSYLHGPLDHWCGTISDEANMKLLSEKELRDDTHYFEHNMSKFVAADWKTMNEGLEIMRRNEIINADEWRRKMNMNKRPDGKGGEYLNPNTKSAMESAAQKEEKKKPSEKKTKAKNAHRQLVVATVNRMARRVGFDAKKAAKEPQKFCTWLDSGAQEHKAVFDESLRPVFNAYTCTFGGDCEQMTTQATSAFFGPLLENLESLTQPPNVTSELYENVCKGLDHFERVAGERVANTILEGSL